MLNQNNPVCPKLDPKLQSTIKKHNDSKINTKNILHKNHGPKMNKKQIFLKKIYQVYEKISEAAITRLE